MILSVLDTFGWPLKEYGRWPGYHERPLTDPKTDPRRKVVVEDLGTRVYGIQNHSIADAIYESDGVLVLTYRIRLDSEGLYEILMDDMQPEDWTNLNLIMPTTSPEPIWITMNPPQSDDAPASTPIPLKDLELADLQEPTEAPDYLKNVLSKVSGDKPLQLTLKADFLEWPDSSKDYREKLYNCNVGITLQKPAQPVVRILQAPVTQSEMTLTNVKITFTNLATYMDIQSLYPMSIGTRPEDDVELGAGLEFQWLDEEGNIVPQLGTTLSGTYESGSLDGRNYERNRYAAFWPAVKTTPDSINLRAYSRYTDECLATFVIPLIPVQDPSPTPSP
jgi:hypothetical protein